MPHTSGRQVQIGGMGKGAAIQRGCVPSSLPSCFSRPSLLHLSSALPALLSPVFSLISATFLGSSSPSSQEDVTKLRNSRMTRGEKLPAQGDPILCPPLVCFELQRAHCHGESVSTAVSPAKVLQGQDGRTLASRGVRNVGGNSSCYPKTPPC